MLPHSLARRPGQNGDRTSGQPPHQEGAVHHRRGRVDVVVAKGRHRRPVPEAFVRRRERVC